MIFGKTRLELKVGIFVFFGLIILAMFVLSIGGIRTWTAQYQVQFVFNFVNGVKVGAPVRFAGVDVGEVKDIKFKFDPEESKIKVHLYCSLGKDIKIPVDSKILVNTLGLLGEKYIEIMPGEDYASVLAENDELEGIEPIPMHEVTDLAKGIVENIDESLVKIKNQEGTIGKLLYDDVIYKELEAFVVDIKKHPWKLLWKTKEKE